jgi:hypothetical protein
MALMMLVVFSPEITPSKLKPPVEDPLVPLVEFTDMEFDAPYDDHRLEQLYL